MVLLVPEESLEAAFNELTGNAQLWHGQYRPDMLNHPVAGKCLRNYLLITEFPHKFAEINFTESQSFWNRYYWLFRFTCVWTAVAGRDAGLEQQLFQLLADTNAVTEPLLDVELAATHAAQEQLRKAGLES